MISFNHEDLIGGLFMTTSQSFFFNQWKLKNLQQKEVVDSTKINAEEWKQVRRRWNFISCELKTLEVRWSFFK